MCWRICILCQETSPKRWFGNMNMTSKLWCQKQRIPNTNDHHTPLNETPHENILRTPLSGVQAYSHIKAVGAYFHVAEKNARAKLFYTAKERLLKLAAVKIARIFAIMPYLKVSYRSLVKQHHQVAHVRSENLILVGRDYKLVFTKRCSSWWSCDAARLRTTWNNFSFTVHWPNMPQVNKCFE